MWQRDAKHLYDSSRFVKKKYRPNNNNTKYINEYKENKDEEKRKEERR